MEKRWVATMMVDIVGSTEILNAVGAEATFALVQKTLQDVAAEIQREDGYVMDFAGDAVFAVFGAPVAVENAALSACRAAVRLQAHMLDVADEAESAHGFAPRLRIGIGGGVVMMGGLGVVEQVKLSALGPAVNLAARLQTLAAPGEIVISDDFKHEVEGFADVFPMGAFEVKGFDGARDVFRLDRVFEDRSTLDARTTRLNNPFVGRQVELDDFRAWLEGPAPQDSTRLIHGPAGIGKSRFVRQAMAGSDGGHEVIVSNCAVSTQNEPYFTLVDIIAHALPTSQTDEIVAADLTALDASLRSLSPKTLALLNKQFSMPGENDAVDIRRDLTQILTALVAQPGRAFVVEDIHWLDAQSADVIGTALRHEGVASKVVFLSRNRNDFDWSAALPAREVQPLTQGDIKELLATSLPDTADIDAFSEKIYEKSEGNPLFAEEILRHVTAKSADAAADPSALLPSIATIGSLQSLVFSRFDLLPDRLKEALKFLAVIDRSINATYLAAHVGSRATALSFLMSASEQGLIEPDLETGEYRFSHALIQDAIASSLPAAQKQSLHLQAAQCIHEHGRQDANLSATLGFHYERGGDATAACLHYLQAARNALDLYALPTCDGFLDSIDGLLEKAGGVEPGFAAKVADLWIRCLDAYGNFRKVIQVYDRYRGHIEAGGDIMIRTTCKAFYGKSISLSGNIVGGHDIVEEAERQAKAQGAPHAAAYATVIKAWIMVDHPIDMHEKILPAITEAKAVAAEMSDSHLSQIVFHVTAIHYRVIGDMHSSDKVIEGLFQYGVDANHNWAKAYAKWSEALCGHIRKDLDLAYAASLDSLNYSVPGTVDWRAAEFMHIAARSLSGDRRVKPQDFEELFDRCIDFGDYLFATPTGQQAAAALILDGNLRKGWTRLQEAGRFAEKAGHKASIYRQYIATGELLLTIAGVMPSAGPRPKMKAIDILHGIRLRVGAVRHAERWFQKYFAYRQVESGFFDVDAHVGLALIARHRKRRTEASHHLAKARDIYLAQHYASGIAKLEALFGADAVCTARASPDQKLGDEISWQGQG